MKLKSWLNIAGILNIILAILLMLLSRNTIIWSSFLILTGFFYKNYFLDEKYYQNKIFLLILGIVNLIFNFISGIIVLEVFGLLKEEKLVIQNEIRKKEKINSLLQLGIVLVILSGIMIATNDSLLFSNLLKISGIIFLSLLFFILSYVSKKYLKIETSFKTYFILGISFIIISFMGLYHYNLLGSLSINNHNSLFFYPLLFLLCCLCSFISAHILKMDKLNNIGISLIIFTIFYWLNALNVSIISNLLIITTSISLINFIYKPSCIQIQKVKDVVYIFSIILIFINIFFILINEFNIYSTLLLLITTLNIFHLLVINKTKLLSILFVPTLIVNSILVVCSNNEMFEIKLVFLQVMMIIFYNLIKMIKLEEINNIIFKINKIAFNIMFISISFLSLFFDNTSSILINGLLILQNVAGIILKEKEELYLEPLKTLLFNISLLVLLNNNISLDFVINIFILEIIEALLYLLSKNNILKKVHYSLYFIMIGLSSLLICNVDNLFLILISLITALIPLIISLIKKNTNIFILLFIIFTTLIINYNPVFDTIYYFNYLLVGAILLVSAGLLQENKTLKYICLYGIFGNILLFINLINLTNWTQVLNILNLVYLIIVSNSLLNNKKKEDIFLTIALIIVCLINFYTSNILVSLTISLISLLMLIIGFIKDFKNCKIFGIIIFILNLIYLLKDFFSNIPLAVYILLVGLGLIGIVIFKEIKENNNQ